MKKIFTATVVSLAISFLLRVSNSRAEEPVKDSAKPPVPLAPVVKDGPKDSDTKPADGEDLRTLIGVNPVGLKRVDVPRMPAMTLRGFIQPRGQPPLALLEIAELNRVFLVKVGTEIPINVAGRVTPVGRGELSGLNTQNKQNAPVARTNEGQSQIILKVLKVSGEGVTVEAGLLAQTIIIR